VKRREFLGKCGQLGLGVAGLAALGGCTRQRGTDTAGQAPGPTSQQTAPTGQPRSPEQLAATDAASSDLKVGNNRWPAGPENIDIAVAQDMKPRELVQAVLNTYGGISSWVKPGDTVAIKPNLSWARQPAQAATTSPAVLAAVIELCKQAEAGRVVVVEHSCDTASVTFDMSGARQVCEQLSIPLISLGNENMYQQVSLPASPYIDTDLVATEILESDIYINLPIAKSHSATVTTGALKNQMGAIWDRTTYHRAGAGSARGLNLHQNIAGLATSLRPTLNIVDATRVLLTGGPKGPGKVERRSMVLVGVDMVAVDAYVAKLLGHDPEDIPYIGIAAEAGVGKANLANIRVARA